MLQYQLFDFPKRSKKVEKNSFYTSKDLTQYLRGIQTIINLDTALGFFKNESRLLKQGPRGAGEKNISSRKIFLVRSLGSG